MRYLRKIDSLSIVRLAITLFFIMFLIIPLISVFLVSFTRDPINLFGSLISIEELVNTIEQFKNATIDSYIDIASRSGYLFSLTNSLTLSISVSIIIVIMCLPIAYGIARTSMPFKKVISALCIVPLVIPTFIAADSITLMFGKAGWVTNLYNMLGGEGMLIDPYSLLGIAIVQVFFFFPYALWPMVAAFRVSDITLEEGSKNLGAKNWFTFIFITLPLAIPGILSSLLLVFTVSFSDFGAPIILAPKDTSLLVVDTYREMTGFFNWGGASILTVVMIVVAGIFLWLQRLVAGKMSYGVISGRQGVQSLNRDKKVTTLLALYSFIVVFIPFFAGLSILVQSFATTWGDSILPNGFTLSNYENILSTSYESLINTMILAIGALVVSILVTAPLTYFVVRKNATKLDFISSIPLVVPGVALAVALTVTFNTAPLKLTGTVTLLIIAFAIRRLPYMVRSTMGTMQSIKKDIEEASINMGASRLTTILTIIAPLMLPGIIAGSILVFVTVVKETSVSVMMAPAEWAPMTLTIFEFLLRGEHYPAAAMAVIMIVIVLILQIIAERLTSSN
ncbi:MAG TPA: iron ABC transporter permease [Bacillota bacterium]|nr:iron ABC transporter permease [Bacillota bacterium]